MRLLVMSDTHGDAEVIKRVRDRHEQVDAIITVLKLEAIVSLIDEWHFLDVI